MAKEGRKRGAASPLKRAGSFKKAWESLRVKTGVEGRMHDCRHTVLTKLAESGASDCVIMSIAGHLSRKMLERYSHIRMEAKREAMEGVRLMLEGIKSPRAGPVSIGVRVSRRKALAANS